MGEWGEGHSRTIEWGRGRAVAEGAQGESRLRLRGGREWVRLYIGDDSGLV